MHVWRDRLHRWLAPAASRCPISPNTITLFALGLNAGAAVSFAAGAIYPMLFLVGMALLAVGGMADAFDGIVARVQGKASRYGDFLDHFGDRVSDTFLISGWLIGNRVALPLAIGTMSLITLNGYIGTQIEATWGRRDYSTLGRGEYVLALIVLPIVSYILAANGWSGFRSGSLTIAEWLAALLALFAALGLRQRLALARRLG